MLRFSVLPTQFNVTHGFYADNLNAANRQIRTDSELRASSWLLPCLDNVSRVTVSRIEADLTENCGVAHRPIAGGLVVLSHVHEVLHAIQIERC